MFNDYALIIGVEDYSAYDRSMDLPAGTSTAVGAVNDAKALYRTCLSMGFSPERIRVLTSPRLAAKDLGPEAIDAMLGDATYDTIVAAVAELCAQLSHGTPVSGLLAFSGHGFTSNGVALCPADLTGSMDQVIHVAQIRTALGPDKVGDNLTMLLDCCRAQIGIPSEESLQTRLRTKTAMMKRIDVPERVIASCQDGQVAEASTFGGVKLGAFTWAVTSALGQWKTTVEKDVARLDVSYGELTSRTKQLLSALSFDQDPQLSGPANVDALPFLHPGSTVHWGETSREPDALRDTRQIDAGQYSIKYWTGSYDRSGNKIWKTFVTVDVSPDPNTGQMMETWTVCTDLVNGLSTAADLQFVSGIQTLSSTQTITQTAPASCTWVAKSSPNYTIGSSYVTFSPSSANYTYSSVSPPGVLAVTFQIQALRSGSDFVQVTWYNPSSANLTMAYQGTNPISFGRPGTATHYTGNCYVAASTFL
jgi:hypothetical protein